MDKKIATIDDVAAEAGVSTSEVVMAMAGDERLDADLHCRITERANDMGYTALAAPRARLGRPIRIAVVFKTFRGDDPDANRFYAPMSSAISMAGAKSGAEIHHAMMSVDAHYRAVDISVALRNGSCDAALLFGVHLGEESVAELKATGCPTVLVDGYSAGDAFDSVTGDNEAGTRAAVDRLVTAGHSHIALLGTEPDCFPSILGRRRGYLDGIRSHGLRPHLIDISYVLTRASAVLGLDYVERHPEVTAVMGANDSMTASFVQLARDAGYRLPADLSVVGFDDLDLAGMMMPALTTLRVDRSLMARAAFALLAYRLEDPAGVVVQSLVQPRLVERDSVAPPPAG